MHCYCSILMAMGDAHLSRAMNAAVASVVVCLFVLELQHGTMEEEDDNDEEGEHSALQ